MILKCLTDDEARDALERAWWGRGGKHDEAVAAGLERRSAYHSDCRTDGSGWVLAHVPLKWVRPNEAGDLYDGTVDPDRAKRYAAEHASSGAAPVHLLYGPRSLRNGSVAASVSDGGHRTSAARMRGDEVILAIMQRVQFELLVKVRDQLNPTADGLDDQDVDEEVFNTSLDRPVMRPCP